MGGMRRSSVAVALAVALLAGACGDDGDGTTTPVETTAGGAATSPAPTSAATSAATTAPAPDEECTAERKGGTLTVGEPACCSSGDA